MNSLLQFERFLGPDLSTHDPYDLWKTRFGILVKKLYYANTFLGIPLVLPFVLLDTYAPALLRAFIRRQEFPIVRAFAALASMNFYRITNEPKYLASAAQSIQWLVQNRTGGYHGACWGLNMAWMSKTGYSPPEKPFVTVTPYCVEALLQYHDLTGDTESHETGLSALQFLELDLEQMINTSDTLALSYGPGPAHRIVINSNSYAMMLYALLASRIPEKRASLLTKAGRLCNYVISRQNADGSWYYFDDRQQGNFIDCFHTCFIIKNLVKYGRLTGADVSEVTACALRYLLGTYFDPETNLARRPVSYQSPSLTRYDLYDQAELLNVLTLSGTIELAHRVCEAILRTFYLPRTRSFASRKDLLGRLHKMEFLRWAILPAVYSITEYYRRVHSADLPS